MASLKRLVSPKYALSFCALTAILSPFTSLNMVAQAETNDQVNTPETVKQIAAAGKSSSYPKTFSGNASWYGVPFHGRLTASGERFDMNKCTCAHLKLPFKTKVLVEDPKTGKSVMVKVTDRGPYCKGRVMDMAKEAARRLGTLSKGVTYIECTVIDDDADSKDS